MADEHIPHVAFPDRLGAVPLELRVWQLERLVLFMSKFITAGGPGSPEEHAIAAVIEDLKKRHPDV